MTAPTVIVYSVEKDFGFAYDAKQDIFYSTMNAWQRKFGYCSLYDEAAAPLGMIIESEPIRFEYEGKKWLIQLWKGQYGMTMGGEIGVYTAKPAVIDIPGFFDETFYSETDDEDHLSMSFKLIRNHKVVFTRRGRHWWLTGFKLGAFAEPEELTMNARITLKSIEMRRKFVAELKRIGYSRDEMKVDEETVYISFKRPYSPQPVTQNKEWTAVRQQANKALCDSYQQITGDFDNSLDKLQYMKEHDRKMYRSIVKSGKSKQRYAGYNKMRIRTKVKKLISIGRRG